MFAGMMARPRATSRLHKFGCYLVRDRCAPKDSPAMLLTEIVPVVAAAVGCGIAVSDRGYRQTNSRGQDFRESR